MPQTDPRVDAYIAKAAPFAQPILAELRARVHAACTEVEEGIKWGMPSFQYRGKILCGMAAFKQHATFGFWQRGTVADGADRGEQAMGQFGRLASVKDLPGKREMTRMIREAMQLIEAGAKAPSTRSGQPRPPLEVPDDLAAALKKNAKARATFDGFAPSHRREYIEWLTEAKQAATRERRLAQAVEWMAEGKSRNWKYQAR